MAFLWIWCLTGVSPYESVGITQDSVSYLRAAESLSDQGKLLWIDNSPYAAWPPLMPVVIWLLKQLPVQENTLFRILNASVFSLYVTTALIITRKLLAGWIFRLAVVFLLFLLPVAECFANLWPEGIFLLLLNVCILLVWRYEESPSRQNLFLLSIAGSLLCLQRYAGVFLIAGLWTCLALHTNRKFFHLLLSGVLSLLPTGIWMFRNYLLTGLWTGAEPLAFRSWEWHVFQAFNRLSWWLLPARLPDWAGVTVSGLAILCVTMVLIKNRTGWLSRANALLFIFVFYFSGILISAITGRSDDISERLLVPLYFPAVLIVAVLMESFFNKQKGSRLTRILLICAGLWMAYPVLRFTSRLWYWHQSGIGEYEKQRWRSSPSIQWYGALHESATVFTNEPWAVYYITRKPVLQSAEIHRLNAFMDRVQHASGQVYLLWIELRKGFYFLTPEDLSRKCALNPERDFSDGRLYELHCHYP